MTVKFGATLAPGDQPSSVGVAGGWFGPHPPATCIIRGRIEARLVAFWTRRLGSMHFQYTALRVARAGMARLSTYRCGQGPIKPALFSFCSHASMAVQEAAMSDTPDEPQPLTVSEAEINETIASFDGDMRATIKALLIGQQYLEIALEMARQEASWGYVRGRPSRKLSAVKEG